MILAGTTSVELSLCLCELSYTHWNMTLENAVFTLNISEIFQMQFAYWL